MKATIGKYSKQNVVKHFARNGDEVIFHLRGVIKEDSNILGCKRFELQQLGKKETFAEFLGQVYLYSLTRDNVLSPEAKQLLQQELEITRENPLRRKVDIQKILLLKSEGGTALIAVYAQELNG